MDGKAFADLEGGPAIYAAACASCHGVNLAGGKAQSLVDGVWQYGARPGQIKDSIVYGIPSGGMPGYADGLSNAQIDDLVRFLLDAQKTAAPEPMSLPQTIDIDGYSVDVEAFMDDLKQPWALVFVDDRRALITEKGGDLHWIVDGQLNPEPVEGTPESLIRASGGMFDIDVDPNYADNGWVYLTYNSPRPNPDKPDETLMATRLTRGRIIDNRWTDEEILYDARPEHYLTDGARGGSRLVFGNDGLLYFTIGDRGKRDEAQDVTNPFGKIHRLHPDGRVPSDNPFVGVENAYESIYSFGHRNPQGLVFEPGTGRLWSTEHGPMGGDELNVVEAGRNYGWPVISYGINYDGTTITEETVRDGMEQPKLYWNPSIAVSGIGFYTGDLFPRWKGQLFVTALKYEELRRVKLDAAGEVVEEQTILKNFGRVRDVVTGPDGALYVTLDIPGRILRLTPAQKE